MKVSQVVKSQPFFKEVCAKWKDGTLKNSVLFLCEDETTSHMALVLTALLMEYPTFELLTEDSAEFQRIESGVEIDVKVFPKNGEKLLVSDSGEIVSEVFVKPTNLPRKVFIIHNFDASTEEAQNKLLKVLEEPPENVYFLLSAKNEELVLPTIKSRCDKVKIPPLTQQEVDKIASDPLAKILGDGYVGKTLALEKKYDLSNIVKLGVELFTEMKSSKQVVVFSKKFLDEKEDTQLLLQVMLLCIEDILKLKCESEPLCKLKPFIGELKDVEPEFSVRALCEIAGLVTDFRERMQFNANLNVAVDNLLLKILEVKFICK